MVAVLGDPFCEGLLKNKKFSKKSIDQKNISKKKYTIYFKSKNSKKEKNIEDNENLHNEVEKIKADYKSSLFTAFI